MEDGIEPEPIPEPAQTTTQAAPLVQSYGAAYNAGGYASSPFQGMPSPFAQPNGGGMPYMNGNAPYR